MRILYIGQGQGFDGPRKYYFTPQKLVNGLTRLGHHVMSINDRDVARYSNVFRSQKIGARAMNEHVLKMCKIYKPHLIMLGHCKNLTNETLSEIRHAVPDVRITYRNVDPIHAGNNAQDILQRSGHVDSIFVTTAGDILRQFSNPNTKVGFMPNPVDPALETERAYANPQADIDFLFLGAVLRDQHDHRAVAARYLMENAGNIKMHIGGAGLNDGLVFGADYYDLVGRSKMGLCMNKVDNYYLYASGRMSQYMGSGVLAFIPTGSQFEDVLGTDSFVSFSEKEDLLSKIRFYAANDAARIKMAQTGCERIHAAFHVDKVCQYILDRTFDRDLSMDYQWPTTVY